MTLKTGNATSTLVTPGTVNTPEQQVESSPEQSATLSSYGAVDGLDWVPLSDEEIQQIFADIYAEEPVIRTPAVKHADSAPVEPAA
jgi:hypothetical protein